jgi:hypothetical protein
MFPHGPPALVDVILRWSKQAYGEGCYYGFKEAQATAKTEIIEPLEAALRASRDEIALLKEKLSDEVASHQYPAGALGTELDISAKLNEEIARLREALDCCLSPLGWCALLAHLPQTRKSREIDLSTAPAREVRHD